MTRPAMRSAGLLAALLVAGSAGAVGLGPLAKSGVTDGPAKGFYLTLYNPYQARTDFVIYAVGAEDEVAQARVQVPRTSLMLPPQSSRKFLIIANGLAPGESYAFRVCAEKAPVPVPVQQQESEIHARVCSRISARRVAAGA